jgi:putative (di)nucleoside polyphosphate hydrolase
MLINRDGRVFVGQRIDSTLEAWQMPQGGIDPGEDALEAALRELREETGVQPDKVSLIAEAPEDLYYDLPDNMIGKVWGGKYRGQRQRWFAFRFEGEEGDIDIATPEPEFRAYRWAEPEELPEAIVGFKRALYERLLELFAQPLGRSAG